MVGSVNARRNSREKERERRGSPSLATSFPGGDDEDRAAARVGLVLECVYRCASSAKGRA
jgi:hypothetical protein